MPRFEKDETGQWWYYWTIRGVETRNRCEERACDYCGELYGARPGRLFCSRSCARKVQARPLAEQHHNWTGGRRVNEKGYVEVYSPERKAAGQRCYVLEHRLVMEKTLGRPLLSTELVHHRNGIKTDNRPQNLELVDRSAHWHAHRPSFVPPHCPTCTCSG